MPIKKAKLQIYAIFRLKSILNLRRIRLFLKCDISGISFYYIVQVVRSLTKRPFRSPHHAISDVALVSGGTFPQQGKISPGHYGVLFLDELPEFIRTVLEDMRQPLEDRVNTISRPKSTVDYPASLAVAYLNVLFN